MKYFLIIFYSILLFFPVAVPSNETGTLFGWKTFTGIKWLSYGDGKDQPKYIGEIKDGKPDGFGNLYHLSVEIEKIEGLWKQGKQWDTIHLNKDGQVIGKYINGEIRLGFLYFRRFDEKLGWYEYADDLGYAIYWGEIEKMKPNGQGTFTYFKDSKYTGGWKEGKYHGQGIFHDFRYFKIEEKYVKRGPEKKIVGEFKDGYEWNTKHYDEDGILNYKVENGMHFSISFFGEIIEKDTRYIEMFRRHDVHSDYYESLINRILSFNNLGQKFTLSNNIKYVGEHKGGIPHGQGTLFFHDGSKWEGRWIDGKEWKTRHYNENGKIIGMFSKGTYFMANQIMIEKNN